MKLHSLGYRTDLIFPAFEGEIIDRGSYLVIRTPTNSDFYFGNFLIFEGPPGDDAFRKWGDHFAEEIGTPPNVNHIAFGWDTTRDEPGEIGPFLEAGFHFDRSVVLTAKREAIRVKTALGITIRQLLSEDDWDQSIENQVICREPIFAEQSYRLFRQGQAQRYREMVSAGLGTWFGAFTGDRLVGDLGIFCDDELGRYQSVQTHPDFRRRGIAGALVYQAGRYAFENHNIERLIIVAEADAPAQRLYESIGFQFTEYQMGVWKAEEK